MWPTICHRILSPYFTGITSCLNQFYINSVKFTLQPCQNFCALWCKRSSCSRRATELSKVWWTGFSSCFCLNVGFCPLSQNVICMACFRCAFFHDQGWKKCGDLIIPYTQQLSRGTEIPNVLNNGLLHVSGVSEVNTLYLNTAHPCCRHSMACKRFCKADFPLQCLHAQSEAGFSNRTTINDLQKCSKRLMGPERQHPIICNLNKKDQIPISCMSRNGPIQ